MLPPSTPRGHRSFNPSAKNSGPVGALARRCRRSPPSLPPAPFPAQLSPLARHASAARLAQPENFALCRVAADALARREESTRTLRPLHPPRPAAERHLLTSCPACERLGKPGERRRRRGRYTAPGESRPGRRLLAGLGSTRRTPLSACGPRSRRR